MANKQKNKIKLDEMTSIDNRRVADLSFEAIEKTIQEIEKLKKNPPPLCDNPCYLYLKEQYLKHLPELYKEKDAKQKKG